MIEDDSLQNRFRRRYGAESRIFRAPGRVNIIGEHTDYNDGFVMPAAIGLYTRVAAGLGSPGLVTAWSENVSEMAVFELDDPIPKPRRNWSDYVHGVVVMLQASGHSVRGANLSIGGNIPLGSGLSSSAALEASTAIAMLGIAGLHLPLVEVALLCQRAENEFVGARTGIMDQFACCHGREGQAIFLDCRTLQHRYIPLPKSVQMLVSNTMVKHGLASGEYNVRREQCEEGVRVLSTVLPQVSSLRDVTIQQLTRQKALLDKTIYRRCLHVLEENQRVERAAASLVDGDLAGAGELMNASHESLRCNYEVSCAELDLMVELARKCPGVYGSRMTGGGFGGCTISLVDASRGAAVSQAVAKGYQSATGIRCETFLCSAVDGAQEERT